MNSQYSNLVTNLFALVVQQMLYKYRVYPQQCFHDRTAVGLQLKSLKDSVLSEYITKLQQTILQLLPIIDCIEILIISNNITIQTLSLNISYSTHNQLEYTELSQFDQDIQLKLVIYNLIQVLNNVQDNEQQNQNKTFKVKIISNGKETQLTEVHETIVKSFIQEQETINNKDQIKQTQLVSSIHLPNFDVLIGLY